MPSQSWLTVAPLPLKLRIVVLLLFLIIKVQAPGLASLMVEEKVVLCAVAELLLGAKIWLEYTRAVAVGVVLSTVTLALLEAPGLPAWS